MTGYLQAYMHFPPILLHKIGLQDWLADNPCQIVGKKSITVS